LNVIKLASRDVHDEFVGLVVGQGDSPPVETEERDGGGENESLVAVDQGKVACQRVQKCGGLLPCPA
jgi:hypothetical protein